MKVKDEYYVCDICNERMEFVTQPFIGWCGSKIKFKKTIGICNVNRWHEYDICHSCYSRMVKFCKKKEGSK